MPRKLPPLNALRAFEAAARHTSFTNAAEELHVTHGAISQQIKVLEDYFKQPLFVRSRGKVSLNEAGGKLLPVISEVLDQIELVSWDLRRDTDDEILTIQMTPAFAGRWLIPRLSSFQAQYPEITIRLSPNYAFTGFQDQQCDVAVRWGPLKYSGAVHEKLFDVHAFAACAPALLDADKPLKSPADLAQHPLIHDDNGDAWEAMLKGFGVENLKQEKSLFFSDTLLALQAAVNAQGVIAAGSVIAAQDLIERRLVIPFEPVIMKRNAYYFYCPERLKQSNKVQVFRQWLLEQAEEHIQSVPEISEFIVR